MSQSLVIYCYQPLQHPNTENTASDKHRYHRQNYLTKISILSYNNRVMIWANRCTHGEKEVKTPSFWGRDKIVVKKWNWQHFEVRENELNPRSLWAISVSNDFFCISEFLKRFTLTARFFFRHNTPLLRRSCMTHMRPWPLTYLHYFD